MPYFEVDGEKLTPVDVLPGFAMVLVNPRIEVPTGAVFAGVTDRNPPAGPPWPERFEGFDGFVSWLRLQRNDLQPSAEAICAGITQTLEALGDAPLARMSGSGATCFALHSTLQDAEAQADAIRRQAPDWWVQAARF